MSRHPKKVANASPNFRCCQDLRGHFLEAGQLHALPLRDPADDQGLLHDLGEVDEQSLSNEGERGVRESERCRRGQGRCEERAGKV